MDKSFHMPIQIKITLLSFVIVAFFDTNRRDFLYSEISFRSGKMKSANDP
ncbi:hypothetical protein RCO48_18730 [Peribacillus frigoritolerans]|nr:hypothetical protein [Peribacillus frigoritolerans]